MFHFRKNDLTWCGSVPWSKFYCLYHSGTAWVGSFYFPWWACGLLGMKVVIFLSVYLSMHAFFFWWCLRWPSESLGVKLEVCPASDKPSKLIMLMRVSKRNAYQSPSLKTCLPNLCVSRTTCRCPEICWRSLQLAAWSWRFSRTPSSP